MKELALSDLHDPVPHDVLQAFARCRKLVMVVGAGISTTSGIPDFRGATGIYTKNRSAAQDLFDASVAFQSVESTRIFYSFMAQLSRDIARAAPTPTHRFMADLGRHGKLLRVYSQNIDYLEARAGMLTGFDKVSKVVPLHGELDRVACTVCQHTEELTEEVRLAYAAGVVPTCPVCDERNDAREEGGRRRGRSGCLRPGIVLYNEPHPRGTQIAELVLADLRRGPDLLVVMGTSLKVPGCKKLIRDVAQEVHGRGGLAVFVNVTPVAAAEWDGIFDYHVSATTDEFCTVVAAVVEACEAKKEARRRQPALATADAPEGGDKENSPVQSLPKTTPAHVAAGGVDKPTGGTGRRPRKPLGAEAETQVLQALDALRPFKEQPGQHSTYGLRSRRTVSG